MTRVLLILFVGISFNLAGQTEAIDFSKIERIDLPKLNNAKLIQEELNKRKDKSRPLEFAKDCDVDASCHTKGTWTIEGDQAIWRLLIKSEGAKSLNFGFTEFYLPSTAKFDIIGMDSGNRQGPFVAADNDVHDQFWSPLIEDDEVLLELKVAKQQKDHVRLHLSKVNHAYFKFGSKNFSASCNLDVVCGVADGFGMTDNYRDIIRSVIMYTLNGTRQCTGMLINNARENGMPYIMTADHCEVSPGNASSFVAFYNFENSTCRQPNSPESGGNGNGTLSTFNTGATWISATPVGSGTDFNLLQLDDPINPNANAYLAGWNREDSAPSSAIGIHHPNTDEKRISYENDPLQITANGGGAPNPNARYLRVVDWDTGTTEPGSSGSPLFDPNGLFIGQLFGGDAACGNNASDYYGRLAVSWEGAGSATTRVKDFLDPDNVGMITLNGIEASATRYHSSSNSYLQNTCQGTNVVYQLTTSNNYASTVTFSVLENSANANVSIQPTTANPGEQVVVTISNTAGLPIGLHSIRIKTEDNSNNASEIPLWYTIEDALPQAVTSLTPADGSQFQIPTPRLSWTGSGSNFDIQIATDVAFTNLVTTASELETTSWLVDTELATNTTYYWRVRSVTACQAGDWSATTQFTTGEAPVCTQYTSLDIPIAINIPNPSTITSTLNVNDFGQVASVKVINVNGQHTYVSDLTISLISPSGTEVVLVANQCGSEDNFNVGFDDNSPLTTLPCPYANTSSYQPAQPLSAFKGELANGTWILKVNDNVAEDGGTLQGWSLEICTVDNPNVSIASTSDTISTCANVSGVVTLTAGTGFSSLVTFAVDSDIPGLNSTFNQTTAQPGESVNLSFSGSLTNAATVVVSATDGNITLFKNVVLDVTPNPAASILSAPTDGAEDVEITSVLIWRQSDNTSMYQYEVATDANFANVVSQATIADTSSTVTLIEDTQYFWRITSINDCGNTVSGVSSFRTAGRFSYSINQDTIVTCQPIIEYVVALQSGFVGDVTASVSGNPTGSMIAFENNPAQNGDTIKITINAIPTVAAAYDMTLTLTDGAGSTTRDLRLTIEESPGIPMLTSPENNAGNIDTIPTFRFSYESAAEYRLQIATDIGFSDVISDIAICNLCSEQLSPELETGTTYYWRVVGQNSCGVTFSPIFQFMTMVGVGIDDPFQAETIVIQPNPTNDFAEILIESDQILDGSYIIYSVGGQLLQTGNISSQRTRLSFESYPKGVYMVRIQDGSAFTVKKLIKF